MPVRLQVVPVWKMRRGKRMNHLTGGAASACRAARSFVIAGCAAIGISTSASAAFHIAPELLPGTTLAEILDVSGPYNGSFHVFDKQFDITAFSGANAADIILDPTIFANPLDGVGFDMSFLFASGDADDVDNETGFANGGAEKWITLDYTVTITDPLFVITDALLSVSGMAMV